MLGYLPVMLWAAFFVLLTGLVSVSTLKRTKAEYEKLAAIQAQGELGLQAQKNLMSVKKQYNTLIEQLPTKYFAVLLGYKRI